MPFIPDVTPCVGVWIETANVSETILFVKVTPCVGVWIETPLQRTIFGSQGHTLRGCVD